MARDDGFFDDLARGLADGTLTRGKALRLMGAAVVGGALGSLGMGTEASADPPGCKRNGKTCTRGTQCCSGNCSGGTCQAQTTTTTTSTSTTTPTTSTSTSTSTTSTSTTSTSTTPMCRPDGETCGTANSECCSGFCVNNTCRPIGNRFTCRCTNSQAFQPCSSMPCEPDSIIPVCSSVCEQNGAAFAAGICGENDVCPL